MTSFNDNDLTEPRPIKPQSRLLGLILEARVVNRLNWDKAEAALHTEEAKAREIQAGRLLRGPGLRGEWE
jgi:hypothetical protein